MAIRARVDRHKCIGAGNCITLAPTAFDWLAGDYGKSDVVGADSVDEDVLRAEGAMGAGRAIGVQLSSGACGTQAARGTASKTAAIDRRPILLSSPTPVRWSELIHHAREGNRANAACEAARRRGTLL